jgi:prolyl oligopeptidase
MKSAILTSEPTTSDVVVDTYHGVEVADPFRWLEGHQSPRTRAWIDDHAEKSRSYLDSLPARDVLRKRITELQDREAILEIHPCGQKIYYTKRKPGEQQAKLYCRAGIHGEETLVIDPQSLGEGDALSLTIIDVSPDGKLLAYGLRTGGQGARRVRIFNLASGETLPDELPKSAIRGFGFLPDSNGFIYAIQQVGKLSDPQAAKIHFLGQPSDRDKIVFYAGRSQNMRLVAGFDPKSCAAVHTVIRAVGGRNLESVHLQMLGMCGNPLMTLVDDSPVSWDVRVSGDQLYVFFSEQEGAGRKLVRVPLDSPDLSQGEVVLADGAERILSWQLLGEKILTTTVEKLSSVLRIYGVSGKMQGTIPLPGPGTAAILGGDAAGCFYSFESYTQPCEVYYYDFAKGTSILFGSRALRLNQIVLRRVQYSSTDGTRIPISLLGKAETFERGRAPVLLTAYGAAGISLTPQYSPLAACFVDLGGLFAIAHVRGGGEFGQPWEEAGKRRNRPTVHKDFIAAAEFLINTSMAAPNRIAVAGGSNSGLLVGTAMTQRPNLFRAVLCIAPILDMLRYDRFDNTQFYVPQFGTASDPEDFPVLLSYSPYHNVRDGERYPALLMVSGDADTRCDPMHARKFVARIQAAMKSMPMQERESRPVLLDWNRLRGHFATLPLSVRAEAIVDRLAFLCHHLEMEVA